MNQVVLKGRSDVRVEAPVWSKGMSYKDTSAKIGEHWTWHYDFHGFSVNVHVPTSLLPSEGDEWFVAKYSAQARYQQIFNQYPNRNDICGSPEENSRNDDLPPGLGTILHYVVNQDNVDEQMDVSA
jgi:hypothetical protein